MGEKYEIRKIAVESSDFPKIDPSTPMDSIKVHPLDAITFAIALDFDMRMLFPW